MRVNQRKNCRGCFSTDLTEFLDLGYMPLAGGFLDEDQIKDEQKIRLKAHFCNNCGLVQILDSVDPQTLFKNYCYVSSVIPSLAKHFQEFADFLKQTYLDKPSSRLLEFGCNDGVLLQNFKKDTPIKILGVDPSVNVSQLGKDKGLDIITGYFDVPTAKEIKKKYGSFDVITGSNVFAHVDDIHEIIKAAKILLKPSGVFIVEVHYLADLLKDFQYDTIYHEHLCYYSVHALQNIFKIEALRIVDVQHLPMHGGGIRVIVAPLNSKLKISTSVAQFVSNEKKLGLHSVKTFREFSQKAQEHKRKLTQLLKDLKKQKRSLAGYGAAGRASILLNYCNINTKILDYMVDVSPLRVGKLMPGVHIPIYHVDKARQNPPDYFLITAWNYAESIMRQEEKLRQRGVKYIIPFPAIQIVQ